MVGCGAMSAEWLRSAKELGVEIAALVDLNIDMARSRATEFQIDSPVYDCLDEAIAGADAESLAMVLRAIESGKSGQKLPIAV